MDTVTLLMKYGIAASEKKMPLPQQNPVSPSSMYEARMKLPENSIKIINENILLEWEDKSGIGMWKGHRVYAIDGSKLNVPRGLLENGYKTPKNTSRHYPYAMMSCLYDVMNGLIYDIDLVEHNNERACALKHFSRLKNNDIIIFPDYHRISASLSKYSGIGAARIHE
ncbi:hypothetical protein [Photorhabdus temperata]|uniref:hypothetical protein n=1 Tax=Photorhabdus temperata TaxID=574560 RepID=UPI0012DF66A3|nr:hypothetical protein [Photorhabdus temperata]